jgi:hypothetical protein
MASITYFLLTPLITTLRTSVLGSQAIQKLDINREDPIKWCCVARPPLQSRSIGLGLGQDIFPFPDWPFQLVGLA